MRPLSMRAMAAVALLGGLVAVHGQGLTPVVATQVRARSDDRASRARARRTPAVVLSRCDRLARAGCAVNLVLEVRGAQAAALGASARHQFGHEGGVIGRATTCNWVLPHAKVSARHATIRFADGTFYIEDKSTNGVFVNQKHERLVRGRSHPLRSGDAIFIDPYDIRVSVSGADMDAPSEVAWQAPDPFGDPFAPQRSMPGDAVRSDLGVSQAASEDRELDPLKLLGGSAPPAPPKRRPQARDLEAASPIAAHYKPPAIQAPPPAVGPHEIPADYDPLADSGIAPLPRQPRPRGGAMAAERPVVAGAAADALVKEVPPADPWDAPLQPVDVEPSPEEPPPVVDEQQGTLDPEAGLDALTLRPNETPVPPRVVADDGERHEPDAAVPVTPLPAVAPVPGRTTPPPGRTQDPPPVRVAESAPVTPALSTGDLAAVLAGAGLEGVEVTEELARDFGRILQVVVSGVMDVLRARQQVKDEFRMRMTQFRPADNNPLKFSANVEDALHNLLVKRNAAYLPPVEAFEDAFADVRGHQLAMLAGMRVAFDTMLAEFNPDRLQDQFDRQLKKGSLLTVPAKLRYWELYRDYSEHLLKDTESAFRKLFGEAFAKAYEEQLNRLKAQQIAQRRDA